ncbi:hypothetical protein GUJ93_ZPchr0013g35753 [Zizania palustris]|uniref:Bifunctional inhibitor/plant lipid transfer protein/seed storage helical domain-containing protein n=1 Tax=Zizania palustris TaxID=103762 RepID=A0A8J6C628_ZIZPA|nr:hypothetical protein GUJ93_ZPchr0013g35753 [Zizania palustris]
MAVARASSVAVLGVVMVAAAALLAARPGAAQGGSNCMTEIISLAPCLGYMSGNSSTPKSSCCTALSSVVTSKPECLCKVLGGGASSLGVAINSTRALELPAACNVKTPPASQCNTVGVPVPSPTAAPATPTTTTPAVPNVTPAGTGSKATPTTVVTGQNSSGASASTAASIVIVVVSAAFALISA